MQTKRKRVLEIRQRVLIAALMPFNVMTTIVVSGDAVIKQERSVVASTGR